MCGVWRICVYLKEISMPSQLDQLKTMTAIVADTGDIEAMRHHQPEDATTNPSLLLKAASLPEYAPLLDEAVAWAKQQGGGAESGAGADFHGSRCASVFRYQRDACQGAPFDRPL
jgi:transaldolase